MAGYLEEVRRGALRAIALQVLAALVTAVLAMAVGGLSAGSAALMGGLIGTGSSAALALWVFAGKTERDPQRFLLRMMLGEMSKFMVAVVLFIIVFAKFKVAVGPLMVGYLAVLVAYWVGLFKSNIGQAR
jgi:F0F1-type ATP synthase assembly protein I